MKRARLVGAALLLLCAAAAGAAPARKPAAHAGAGSAAAGDSDQVLVRIGSEAITLRTLRARLDELPEQYRAQYTTPEGRQQLLDRLVEERVWMQDAARHGVPERETVKRQLEQQRRDLVIRTWVNELMAQSPAPSDSEARAYYDAHQSEFRTPPNATVRHIQTRTEAEARKVLVLARGKGADWNQLVRTYTTDTLTRANGGSLGTVTREGGFGAIGTQPALAESALAHKDGEVIGPYHTDRGWHVLKLDAVHAETLRPFDQVRAFIVRQLGSQRQQAYYQELLARAKAGLHVTPDSAAIRNWRSARKSAREMFNEAQNAGGPEQRIEAYRQVVEEWPAADVTPQAQFMQGFIYSEELKNYDQAEKAFRELLRRWPHSELATSAQWMVDHMRTEEAPDFLHAGADSGGAHAPKPAAAKGPGGAP